MRSARVVALTMAVALLARCHGASGAKAVIEGFSHDADDLRVVTMKADTFGKWNSKLGSAAKSASGADATRLNKAMQASAAIKKTLSDSSHHVASMVVEAMVNAVQTGQKAGATDADLARFEEVSTELYTDFACSLVWKVLKPDEQTEVKKGIHGGTVHSTVDVVVEASTESVRTAAIKLFAGAVSEGFLRAADWGIYANELRSNVEDIVDVQEDGTSETLSVEIAGPVTTHTRAFYEYAKVCLKPPV
jgi:hypothetical protein